MASPDHARQTSEILRLAQQLQDNAGVETKPVINELIEAARSLGVPTHERRDDAPVFLDETESIETATWAQCGGLLFALSHDELRGKTGATAARVALRIALLAPARIAHDA